MPGFLPASADVARAEIPRIARFTVFCGVANVLLARTVAQRPRTN